MAESSSDSDSDSVPEEERLQQKLLQVTKNKWNKPATTTKSDSLEGKQKKTSDSDSSSESSDDENSQLFASNNKNKEMELIVNNFEALKAKVKQLPDKSVTNNSKQKKGKFALQLKKSNDDVDTDDSEKIANSMKNTMKQTATKPQTSDSDTDSDESTKITMDAKGNPAVLNSTILNSAAKAKVPLVTSTPNITNKFIQAASLSTKKDLLHKILADTNDTVNFIKKNDYSTPTLKPKSILKHSAQKTKPNDDDSDSDRHTLPLNQEGFKSKHLSSDSDTSFTNVISSTQIKHSQISDGNSGNDSRKLSQNDATKKRLSFSKVISTRKSISPDLDTSKNVARKTESSSSEESEDESNMSSKNNLNTSNNKIVPQIYGKESSSSSDSEDDSNITSKHKSTVITKVFTQKSTKKSSSKDDLPSELKENIKKTMIISPKKLLSVKTSRGSANVSTNKKMESPKKSVSDSSEDSDSEDDVPNIKCVSSQKPASSAVAKQINTNLNSSKTKISPKSSVLSDSPKNMSASEKLKNQNNITKDKRESSSDSDSEDEKITNLVPKSNIPLNSSKITQESSSDSSDSEMEQTNTSTSKINNTKSINNSPPKTQCKNTQESSDSSDSEIEITKAPETEKKTATQKISPKSNILVNNLKNTQDSSSDSSESETETTKSSTHTISPKLNIQVNNLKNTQDSSSDSSESETETTKSSTHTISPKLNIQVNNLKNTQDSSSDSSESETETTKAAESKRKSSVHEISPKSNNQVNNLKDTQDSSADSSESETETTKASESEKKSSPQRISPKSNIQVNNLKNTQDSSSESSESETESTKAPMQKLSPKSNIQRNNLKNTEKSSSESSDSETETKNNLSPKKRETRETQLDTVKSQYMLKHKNILNDICSGSSSNESSSSGGKKKKELPKTKISSIKKPETVSTSDSSDDEHDANKPGSLKERIKTLCDVEVVDTAPILKKQQVSQMYDTLKEYALTHPNLQGLDAKTNLLLDDFDDDVEIWLTQCPKSLVPSLLLSQKLNLDKDAKLKLKVSGTKYECVSQRTNALNLCLIGSESVKNPKLSAKIVQPVGTLIIQQALKDKKPIYFKKEEHFNVEPPANLKLRHPIFGSNFKDKLDLDDEVQQKLLQAEIVRRKLERKAEKKKQRELNAKSEKKMDEHTNKDEIIFQLLNQTKTVTTEEHLKKKSKKRKMSDIQDEGQSSSKISKVAASQVDSPVKLPTKNKRKSKSAENDINKNETRIENVKNAKKELNDSKNTLIENVIQPTLPVKIKKKKSHEVLTLDDKLSNSISNPSIADPKITLVENIPQTAVKSNVNAPIKHKSNKNKQQKTLNIEKTFINQNTALETKTEDPKTDVPVKIKKKKSHEMNAPKILPTMKELKVDDQHKKKHKKKAIEMLDLDDSPQKINKEETNESFDNNAPNIGIPKKKSKNIKGNEMQIVSDTDLNSSTLKIKKDKHKHKSMTEEIAKEALEMADFSPKKERKKKDKDSSVNITDSSKKKNKKRDSEIIDKDKLIQELLNPVVQSTWVDKKSKKRKNATSIATEVSNMEITEVKKKKKSKK